MAAAVTRTEAVETLEAGQRELDALFARLDDEAMVRPATIGGGAWSAKDLLGHLAFWEELALDAVEAWAAGRRPWAEAVVPGNVDAANAANEVVTARQSLETVRGRAGTAHAALLQVIARVDDEWWAREEPPEGEQRRARGELLGGLLGAPGRPFGHAWAHLDDLRAYVVSLES